MNEINYQEKFSTFQAITENHDYDVAMRYLQEANWDENEAARNYFKSVHQTVNNVNSNNNNQNSTIKNKERDPYRENLLSNSRAPIQNTRPETNNNNNQRASNVNNHSTINSNGPRQRRTSFMDYVKSLFCCGQSREEDDHQNTLVVSIFESIPGKVENFDQMMIKIKEKIAIIVVYKEKDVEFETFISKIIRTDHVLDVLRVNFIIHPVLAFSEHHNRLNFLLGIKKEDAVAPAFLFVSHKNSQASHLTGHSLIEQLLAYPSIDNFYETLVRVVDASNSSYQPPQLSNKKPNNHHQSNQKTNNRPPDDSHAAIINEQKEELMNLLREEEEKKKKKIEEENRIKREIEEKKEIERKKEEERQNKIKRLSMEPASDNQDAALIVFRYPDGNSRSERRFLKSEKVSILYDYVDSLGNIFVESDKYHLIQAFPRKVYENKDKTLAEEGLFPNAVLQIEEL